MVLYNFQKPTNIKNINIEKIIVWYTFILNPTNMSLTVRYCSIKSVLFNKINEENFKYM